MLDLVFSDESIAPPEVSGPDIAVWRDDVGEVFASAGHLDDGYWLKWRHLGTFSFAPGSTKVSLRADSDHSRSWLADQFHCLVQPVILQALGREALHASAVQAPDGVVAFCGVSGSGKSTLAYAVGREPGYRQIADDALVLDVAADDVRAVILPFRPRLRPSAEHFFSKQPSDFGTSTADRRGPILRAVFILAQRADGIPAPIVTPISRSSAFAALLTHAHCFDEADRAAVARMAQAYLTIADRVPVFALSYRPDFGAMSALVTIARGPAVPVLRE